MQILGLQFHKFHRQLICSCGGGAFINLVDLLSHYRDSHRHLLIGESAPQARCNSRHRTIFLASVVEHFAQCLDIPHDQPRIVFTESTLDGPIYGLGDAEERPQCTSCDFCAKNVGSLAGHHRVQHGAAIDKDMVVHRLCQTPNGGYHRRDCPQFIPVPHRLAAPASEDSSERAPPNSGGTLPQPYAVPEGSDRLVSRWLSRVGWPKWIDELVAAGWKASELVALVAPPRRGKLDAKYPRNGNRRKILDWAERLISTRLTKMAEDANIWLTTCSPEMRMVLAQGYVLFAQPIIYLTCTFIARVPNFGH